MTPPDPANLTGPALRDAVAIEVMGWKPGRKRVFFSFGVPITLSPMPHDYPNDPAATRAMEDEIERRGLGKQYASELLRLVYAPPDWWCDYSGEVAWAVIRATGEAKCRAALAAVRGTRKETDDAKTR